MTEVINVRYKPGGKEYYFDPGGLTVSPGEGVILDTVKGPAYGECTRGNHLVTDDMVLEPLRQVSRLATEEDMARVEENRKKEKKALEVCRERVLVHNLDMVPVSAEYSFEGNKVTILFTSDKRVDFRALVRDLASSLHARIELRQIGVRDEARMIGGLGICGRPFCCGQFLNDFEMVSIKMAKTQGLSLNPAKISGACGRLMCCLKYEQDAYADAAKRCPKISSFVETPDGVGNVTDVDLLRERVKVSLDGSDDPPRAYYADEIRVVSSGKNKRPEGYVPPPPEELEALRRPREPRELSEETPAAEQRTEQPEKKAEEPARKNTAQGEKRSSGSRNRNQRRRQKKQTKPKTEQKPAATAAQEQKWEDMAGAMPSVKKMKNSSRRRGSRPKDQQGGN
ncbi:MAG: stage 0 sporulation family protein [Oscillospiraceae bacterium]|nr:stage 0 sporulation family protein [Oscillospiraceae bacterium]